MAKTYFITTSSNMRLDTFPNEYTASNDANELFKKAGELSVPFKVELWSEETDEDGPAKTTRMRTWSR